MKLKKFDKEKAYRKLNRNSKAKQAYIAGLLCFCVFAIVIAYVITNSFAFKNKQVFTLVDGTTYIESIEPIEFAYAGKVQQYIVPTTGYYEVELWGAKGGNSYGGNGGYTKGTIYLEKGDIYYFYIGQNGHAVNINCGNTAFNGGGSTTVVNTTQCGSGGGGATDIRLTTDAKSRIMVAGGGGGGSSSGPTGLPDGGGLIGKVSINASYQSYQGLGGTQVSGGETVTKYPSCFPEDNTGGSAGIFGIGGTGGKNSSSSTSGGGGSGGSGYYGGSGSTGLCSGGFAGGGGSSYISGYAGVNSVQELGGTIAQPSHTNNTIHYSGKYFIDGEMQSGVNAGNGKAKITFVGKEVPERKNTKLDNVRYIKICSSGIASGQSWMEIQAVKNGINVAKGKAVTTTGTLHATALLTYLTDGIIEDSGVNYAGTPSTGYQCFTVDLGETYDLDEVGLWGYWRDGRKYNDNTLSVGSSNAAGTTSLETILHSYIGTSSYVETSAGKRYTSWMDDWIGGHGDHTGGSGE